MLALHVVRVFTLIRGRILVYSSLEKRGKEKKILYLTTL
jgi:hypothetical protein